MPTEVKICGLTSAEAVDAALAAGADYVGFVVFPPSPRHLDIAAAGALIRRVRRRAATVVLVVDPDDRLLDSVLALTPDYVQFHGRETPERMAAIRAAGHPVIKALGIAGAADLALADAYAGAADMLVLDSKPPRNATRPGGHGAAFDWTVLESFRPGLPWLLSGGLDAANVATALRVSGAGGVDVSSGVERAPGHKDPTLIRAFVTAARAADRPFRRAAGAGAGP